MINITVVITACKSTSPIGFCGGSENKKINNEYFTMIANNSVKIGLVTVLRICECRQILSWDTLTRFGLKYREIY